MKKDELITKMAKDANISKRAAGDALKTFLSSVTMSLKKGQKVSFVGFGTFSTSKRKARTGRNPKTGESIKIPAARVPKFKAGKTLKDAVKKKR
ncbi:MAG: HU family DNA-binding protein [candidate division Zixibacteria bacterium]|nr:HU family DNA-binding protein [candidate division Zixibacteria bacterium]